MRLLRLIFGLSVLALVIGAKAAFGVSQPIYVVNHSTKLTNEQIADALPAFQAAIDQDFGPAWNAYAQLNLLANPPPGTWQIEIVDLPNCWGCAGYHKVAPGHVPWAQVGVLAGVNWQLVFTHELFELLADPYTDRAAYILRWPPCEFASCAPTSDSFWAIEVADPVEYIHFAYNRRSASGKNVVISDFVLPRWYDCQGGAKLDFVGHVKHCRHLLFGGYQYVYQANQWKTLPHVFLFGKE